jgi:hypothetical protein
MIAGWRSAASMFLVAHRGHIPQWGRSCSQKSVHKLIKKLLACAKEKCDYADLLKVSTKRLGEMMF